MSDKLYQSIVDQVDVAGARQVLAACGLLVFKGKRNEAIEMTLAKCIVKLPSNLLNELRAHTENITKNSVIPTTPEEKDFFVGKLPTRHEKDLFSNIRRAFVYIDAVKDHSFKRFQKKLGSEQHQLLAIEVLHLMEAGVFSNIIEAVESIFEACEKKYGWTFGECEPLEQVQCGAKHFQYVQNEQKQVS